MIGRRKTATTFIARLTLVLLLIGFVPIAAEAQQPGGGAGGGTGDPRDANPGSAALNMRHFYLRMKNAREFSTTEFGGADVLAATGASSGTDRITNGIRNLASGNFRGALQSAMGQDGRGPKESVGPGTVKTQSGPTFAWPVPVPPGIPSTVPTKRDEGINKNELKTFGYPVSDTQFQLIQRYNQNIMLEQLANPERFMWAANTLGGLQSTAAANSANNMATNQAISAIDFSKKYLVNFTAEQGNVWHRLRDQLFIPMALLLLLPGAVLAQVKAIVAQGSPSWAQADSPIEGITRSIIAIFLIPATFLVINYGIDVSNSITFTIADEYRRIFGTDMYEDAICHEKRALAINPANRRENAIHEEERPVSRGPSVWSSFEGLNSTVREYDPCLGVDNTRVPDENFVQAKNFNRLAKGLTNTGLTAAWNIMSAFQMAYLYYLWCMGPIAAALWVWPIGPMRGALRSWIEGVITICFWSLFWNTTVLLLACFKGVGDDGSIIVTALNTLANLSVKKAFDFAGLVAEGGAAAAGKMQEAMQGGGGGGGAGRGGAGGTGGAGGMGGQGTPGSSVSGPGSGRSVSGPGSSGDQSALAGPGGSLALSPAMGQGGDLATGALTPRGGDIDPATGLPRSLGSAGVDPGLPPQERTNMGMRGGAGDATEAAALAALGANGMPPSAERNQAFQELKRQDDMGHPAATAVMESLARTQPGDLDAAMQGDAAAAARIKEATGMDAGMLNNALRGDPASMMTAAALVGAAGSAGAAGGLIARAEAGDQRAIAQLEGRTGVNAGTLISAARGDEGAQTAVMARAGLDDSVREAAMRNGDPICGAAVQAADMMYARNAATGDYTQIAAYDPGTGRFAASDAQGNILAGSDGKPLISYDSATGSYRTEGGAGVGFDASTGQWMARDANGSTGGGIVYDINDRQFEVAGTGAKVDYANGGFTAAGTGGNVVWDAQQNRFEDRATGGVVMSDPGGSGQWFRVAQDGQSIERLSAGAGGQASWERAAGAPMEVRNGEVVAGGTNGNVVFDQMQGRFEARNADVGLQYDRGSNQWYAQGSSGQVAYAVDAGRFTATGSSEGVTYSGGQWSVDGTGGRVVFDAAQGRYEVAGANAPVSFDRASNNWVAADTAGQIRFDRQDMRFETSQGSAAVVDPNGTGRWYAASADGAVQMLSPASSGSATWSAVGADSPVSYSNGTFVAQGSGGSVFFDQKAGQWELRQQNAQGQYVDTNIAMARDSASGNWVASGTGGQVVLDPATRSLEMYGSNVAVARDATGSFVAANTGGTVFLDTQNASGARWEVRGTDTPVMQGPGGQWVAADSRGGVVWDAQQNRFEQAGTNVPAYRDPGGSGWYSVAANGMVTQLGSDSQWRSIDPATSPIRVDQGGAITAASSNGMIQFDQRDNRWEIAGTNQAVQYDSRSQQWVAPETGGRVAYDFNDKRLEVLGPSGTTTNVPVVSDPGGRGYYAFASNGEVRQLDSSAGSWRAIDQSAGVAFTNGQLISTASIAPNDATRTPQVVFDTQQGRWEVQNNPTPGYNGIAVTQVGGGFYADGTGRQIEYDLNNRRFELAGSNRPVEFQREVGWTYAGTGEQVALRLPDGGWTAGTHASTDPTQVTRGYDPFANPAWRQDAIEYRGDAGYGHVQAHVGHDHAHIDVNHPDFRAQVDVPTGAIMDAPRREGNPLTGNAGKAITAAGVGAAIWQQWSNISNRMNRGQQGPAPSLQDMMRKGAGPVKKKDNRKIVDYDEFGNPIYEQK
ncbi:MAG: hypothetical protein IT343_05890 [Candidatus Melainabacteria bacterium]|jgi:hypothetical protein|nr:hypothetical protein [Candidatus Melainabacteria bacterium]